MKAREYDLLMPRRLRASAGVPLGSEPFNRRSGVVPTMLMAARLPGGSIGTHAAAIDGTASLCNCTLISTTKDNQAVEIARDTRNKRTAAASVTCKFCAARLLQAGVIAADDLSAAMPADSRAYAIDYSSRGDAETQLAALEQAQAAEQAAAAKAAAKAAREAAKAAKAAKAAEATA